MLDPTGVERADASSSSLRANFSWVLAGNLVYAALRWALLVVLARAGTPADVGTLALGFAVAEPVTLLTRMQLRVVLATDARRVHGFGDYLAVRVVSAVAAAAAVALIALWALDAAVAAPVIVIGIAKSLESLSDIAHGVLQREERMRRIGISLVAKGLLTLAAFSVGFLAGGSLTWATIGMAGAWVAILVGYDVPSVRRFEPDLTPAFGAGARAVARTAAPLGVVMMLTSLDNNTPRYFLERFSGTDAVGFFSALTYVTVAGNMVSTSLGESAGPRLARAFAAGDATAFARLLGRLLAVGLALGTAGLVGAALFGRWVLALLYGAAYARFAGVLELVMVAMAIQYLSTFLGLGLTVARALKVQTLLYLCVVVANAAACALLVPSLGIRGGAYALIASSAVHLTGTAIVSARLARRLFGARRRLPPEVGEGGRRG